jgi:hypothetical protein
MYANPVEANVGMVAGELHLSTIVEVEGFSISTALKAY